MQLNNVWVTSVLGNPTYVACRNCRTKIDPDTGHCKRHDTHSCQTERDDEIAILATVNLADRIGEMERILVDEQNLQALAAVASKEQLLTLLQKRGPAGICFKHPVDAAKLAFHDPMCLPPLPVCCRRKRVKQQLCNCQNVSFKS